MGEETARLRAEIDRTRDDLTRNVDQLADRTSPSRIVERRVQRTRDGLVGLKERVMGSSETSRTATYGPTYTDEAYPLNGESEGSSRAAELRDSATGAAQHTAERAQQTAARAQDAAHGAVHGARRQTEGNPLAAGVIAFGVGWLISSLMPASNAETQAAQRAGELARDHGGPVLDQAKQSAQEVGEHLKGQAQDAAQQVKESAQGAAGTVKDEAAASTPG